MTDNEPTIETAKQPWTPPVLNPLDNDANDICGARGVNLEGLGTSDS